MSLSNSPTNILAQSREKLAELYRLHDQLQSLLQFLQTETIYLNNFLHPVSTSIVGNGTSVIYADANGINFAPISGYGSIQCAYSPPTSNTNASISLAAITPYAAGATIPLNINTKGTGSVIIPSGTQLAITQGGIAASGVQWNSSTDTLTGSSSVLNYQATSHAFFSSTNGGNNWSYYNSQISFPTLTSQGSITATSSSGISLDSQQTVAASGNNLVISAGTSGTLQLCSNNGIPSPFAQWTSGGVTFPNNVNVTGTMTYSNFNLHGSLFSSSNSRPAYAGYVSAGINGGYGYLSFLFGPGNNGLTSNSPNLSFLVCTPAIASTNGQAYYTTVISLPVLVYNPSFGNYYYQFKYRSSTYTDGENNYAAASSHPFYWFAF